MSPTFTFYLGADQIPVVVNVVPLAEMSLTLNAMMNGSTADAAAGEAYLEDVEEEDFVRLCEFAYTGTVSMPRWGRADASEEDSEDSETKTPAATVSPATAQIELAEKLRRLEENAEPEVEFAHTSLQGCDESFLVRGISVRKILSSRLGLMRGAFRRKYYSHFEDYDRQRLKKPDIRPWVGDLKLILLAHARLYLLADKYIAIPLKRLVFRELFALLERCIYADKHIEAMIQLVRYVYGNGGTYGFRENELRTLVCDYMVSEMTVFGGSEAFEDLLQEGGEFVRDFWRQTRIDLYAMNRMIPRSRS